MTVRRIVTGFGVAIMVFGVWTLARAHSRVGTCTTTNGVGPSHSGIDSSCVQTLMSYSLGFVFVASGLIIAVIALTMIAKQERMDLHSELRPGQQRSNRHLQLAGKRRRRRFDHRDCLRQVQ